MRTAIAFGGHGNNILTKGKNPEEGTSRIPDIRALSLRYRRAFDVLACADYVVGTNFGGMTFWDALESKTWVNDTRLYQPLKVALDVAMEMALEDELGCSLNQIAQLGFGLSLGEITALSATGTWHNVETSLHLVFRRGDLIMKYQPNGKRMNTWALIRCGWEKAREAVTWVQERFSHGATLALTNNNATEIVLVAGEEEALESLVMRLKEDGTRVATNKNLNLGAVFHHPGLREAARPFLEAVYESGPVESTIPVLSNVTGMPHTLEHLAFQLGEHLWHPVQFARCIEYLKKENIERVIVIGGGAVVSLLQSSFDRERVVVIDSMEDIRNARTLLAAE